MDPAGNRKSFQLGPFLVFSSMSCMNVFSQSTGRTLYIFMTNFFSINHTYCVIDSSIEKVLAGEKLFAALVKKQTCKINLDY